MSKAETQKPETDIDEITEKVVENLGDNRVIGDKVVLTRREAILISAGMLSLPALLGFGAGSARAQNTNILRGIEQIGTDSDRVNDLYVDNLHNFTQSETFDNLTINDDLTILDRLVAGADISLFDDLAGADAYEYTRNISLSNAEHKFNAPVTVDGPLTTGQVDINSLGKVSRIQLEEEKLSTSGTFAFTSLPSDFESLTLVMTLRSTRSDTDGDALIRFNDDSDANYEYIRWSPTGSGGGEVQEDTTSIRPDITAANSESNHYSRVGVDITGYADTDKYTTFSLHSGHANFVSEWFEGFWGNTDVVTSITIEPNFASDFAANSKVTMYGDY